MILSMKPPYEITNEILRLVSEISQKIGEINANHLYKPATELRKKNKIKTIRSSLEIEGNTLTEEHITALLENKRVIAPQKDILEVQNAIRVYDNLKQYNPLKIKDMEKAHQVLMDGLIPNAGKFRTTNVGIIKGSQIEHIAPSGGMVNGLMKELFSYLKNNKDLTLIKSCVFHYEFEFLPIEVLIKERQEIYYAKLSESDKKRHSTPFVEFMLNIILDALEVLLNSQNQTLKTKDRIALFQEKIGSKKFSRKDYLQNLKSISAPTASRDLKWAVEQEI